MRTCRCGAIYRPEKTLVTDKRGRLLGYADSPWPYCPKCSEALDALLAVATGRADFAAQSGEGVRLAA